MKTKAYLVLWTFAALFVAAPTARPQALGETVVSLDCVAQDGQRSRGTGVVVSARGHVLTAAHVAPPGYRCMGAIGNASLPPRGLIRDPRTSDVDATLLRFTPSPGERFKWLKVCRLDEALTDRTVVAIGFPAASDTGEPSPREGVLSTLVPNDKGVIESDALTGKGMSGGAVTLKGSSNLLGIIAGAKTDKTTALASSYGVLIARFFLNTFGDTLTVADTCESNGGGNDPKHVDAFFEIESSETSISRLARFGEDVASIKKQLSEGKYVEAPQAWRANEFNADIPTWYIEITDNPPRTNRRQASNCKENNKIIFFFRNGRLFRVSYRSWYSPHCTDYDGYFYYVSQAVGASIEDVQRENTGAALARTFVAKGNKVTMIGWLDRRVSVIDIAETSNDDFMSDDWRAFILENLKNPW